MSVNGEWVNAFNSVVALQQDSTGQVIGVYSSTTGSSGSYWAVGFTDPNPLGAGGQSLTLSLLWRPIEGATPDASWHYVSGFSGQLVTLNNVPTLNLIHDMVATLSFPPDVAKAASYIDKLTYTPSTNAAPVTPRWPPSFTKPAVAYGIDGTWICAQHPTLTLTLVTEDETFGYVTGSMTTAAGAVNVIGFTDTYAAVGGLKLQGLSLSALLADGHTVAALAGALDFTTGILSLTSLQSAGTTSDLTWVQTQVEGLTFTRRS